MDEGQPHRRPDDDIICHGTDFQGGVRVAKHIKTLVAPALQETARYKGCTQCAVSCQSACKTSCTVGNIVCPVSSLLNPAASAVTTGR